MQIGPSSSFQATNLRRLLTKFVDAALSELIGTKEISRWEYFAVVPRVPARKIA
jgi:hypothetical protein